MLTIQVTYNGLATDRPYALIIDGESSDHYDEWEDVDNAAESAAKSYGYTVVGWRQESGNDNFYTVRAGLSAR